MQATLTPTGSKAASNRPLTLFKILAALSILLLAGGGIWYIAITGIIGNKKWDFMTYGLGPAIMAGIGGAMLLGTLIAFFFHPYFHDAAEPVKHDFKRDKYMYLLILPGLLVVFVFSYMPMYGIILAFKDYKVKAGIMFSQWCGFENFERFFGRAIAGQVIGNTLFIGLSQLIITFPVPILLALLLNELKSNTYRRITQTIIYLPHFISWVIMYSLLFSLFSITSGLINKILISMGVSPINLLSDPDMFYPMLYFTQIWKEAGWGTIIYMAAIAGVDQEMYEAAYLDGANRLQQVWYITLPAIAFSVTTMLILNVGSVMGANFDQIMNLRTAATETTVARVIDTYVYDMGVSKGEYDLSTAIGLFQQIVNCVLLFTSNAVVKKMNGEGFF